jgi:hypothetical protein
MKTGLSTGARRHSRKWPFEAPAPVSRLTASARNDRAHPLVDHISWIGFMPPGLNLRRYERPLAERRLTDQRARPRSHPPGKPRSGWLRAFRARVDHGPAELRACADATGDRAPPHDMRW